MSIFFFFKQKTAYEMRISDWSSDVCSSDLLNKLFDSGLSAMGAIPVSMPGSEVYQALQTRVIDAALTGVQAASSRKFYEVQDYGAATAIFVVFDNLVVNPEWWDGLPEDVRAGITRAADKAVQSRSEEHTYELQSLMRNSYAVFCL